MKSIKHTTGRIAATVAAMALSVAAWAVPAKPGLLTVKMADGSTIKVRIVGDEWGHYYVSEDGLLLTRGADDYFYYSDYDDATGTLKATSVRANDVQQRSANERDFVSTRSKQLPASLKKMPAQRRKIRLAEKQAAMMKSGSDHNIKDFPTTGKQKTLAILVEFKDRKFQTPDPHNTFHDFMMKEGFSHENGAHFSVRDYYTTCSGGAFEPEFDVYGPVTLSQNLAYYGGNDIYGNDDKPEEMVIEACRLLADQIDFSQYDRNSDGWGDNVYIFYAGYSEAEGASANSIWPHSWDIWIGAGQRLVLDGVQIGPYGCSQELNIQNDQLVGIGVFCHEFGHVLGLIDLYDTQYGGLAFTPGEYSLMDAGEYTDNSNTPPYLTAYERWVLGWHTPTLIDRAMNATLPPISGEMMQSYMIETTNPNEMYILENRQQQGYDEFIPGHGMLVWHIDFDEDSWTGNDANIISTHQRVDIVEADGMPTEESRAGDPFPGTAHITSFTDNSYPSMKDWSGNALNLPITEISEDENGIITFKVLGGVFELDAVKVEVPTDVTATSFTLTWNSVARANEFLLNLYVMNGSNREYVYQNYSIGNVNRYTVTGLQPETTYYATISASDGSHQSAESNVVSATTLEPDFSFYVPTVLEATAVTGNSFVANWEPLDEATCYYLTVLNRNNSGQQVESIDFIDAADSFPDGWTTNCNSFVITDGCFGVAAPSLSMRQTGSYVTSPLYQGEISQITFWYKGAYMDPTNIAVVQMSADGEDWEILDYLDISSQTGNYALYGDGQEITLPPGIRQFRIYYEKSDGSTGGFVYLDDLRVVVEGYDDPIVLEGYDDREVGDVQSFTVNGLTPNTQYIYRVRAHNGSMYSLSSPDMAVVTDLYGAVGNVSEIGAFSVHATDGTLAVKATSGSTIEVYTTSGAKVAYMSLNGSTSATIPVAPGIYVVKCGAAVKKIIVP